MILAALAVLGVVTLLVTAFDPGASSPAPTVDLAVAGTTTGRPSREVVATVGNLKVELPVAQSAITAVGFHGATDGALDLQPVGPQANEGLLARLWRSIAGVPKDGPVWYQLEGGPGTGVLDVGAARGTDVYAPVDGSVVGISDVVIADQRVGSRVDIRPTQSPSVIVALSHVSVDPAIAVGSQVLATSSRVGTAVDVARLERQSLADHTSGDGNNVTISVYPSAGAIP